MSLSSPNRGYPLERLEGEVGSMGAWVRAFARAATALEGLRSRAQDVSNLPGEGDAIVSARSAGVIADATASHGIVEAERLSRVLADYADAFSAHAVPANRMIDEIEDAHAAWERATADAERAEMNALWTTSPGMPDLAVARSAEEASDAHSVSVAAKAVLDELWEVWERCYTAWDEAYDAAVSILAFETLQAPTADERALVEVLLGANGATAVLAVWNAHPGLRGALAARYPDIIGNLDGVPFDVRAEANLHRLTVLNTQLNTLAEPLRSEVRALWKEVSEHGGHLVSLDLKGSEQATAAVWYGPFDATNVSLLVPGMRSQVAGIGGWGNSARARIDDTQAAAIAWFGYDSPGLLEERSMSRATDGAASLQSFLRGLDAQPNATTINVHAHSYGSSTAALAIGSAPDGLGVDRFIVYGSAGFPDDDTVLANLQSPDAPRIFATIADHDRLAPFGRVTSDGHGVLPESLPGVTEFDSDGGVDRDGRELLPTHGHGALRTERTQMGERAGYLEPGGESFENGRAISFTGDPLTEAGGQGSAPSPAEVTARRMGSAGLNR